MGKRLIIKGASFLVNAIDRVNPSTTYYSVIYNLSHCISSNNSTSVAEGSTYSVTISAQTGYTLSSVVVRHNGSVVSPVSGNTYRITNVSGNITITATATSVVPTDYHVTYDLENATSSNNATSVSAGSSYSVTLTPNSGYRIIYASVTHNGMDVNPTSGYTYNIPSVSGNILVECVAIEQSATTYSVVYNLTNCVSNNQITILNAGDSYSFALTPNSGYQMASATVTHNGVEVTGSNYTYNISNVSGDIIVTALAESAPSNVNISSNMVVGYFNYNASKGRCLVGDCMGDTTITNHNAFCVPTENGTPSAIPFSSGEFKIIVPTGKSLLYRPCMLKNDGTVAAVSTDIVRGSSVQGGTIYASEIPSILGLDPAEYPYWGVNIGLTSGGAITVNGLISRGVQIIKNPTE